MFSAGAVPPYGNQQMKGGGRQAEERETALSGKEKTAFRKMDQELRSKVSQVTTEPLTLEPPRTDRPATGGHALSLLLGATLPWAAPGLPPPSPGPGKPWNRLRSRKWKLYANFYRG